MYELWYLVYCRCRPALPRFYEPLLQIKTQGCMNTESLQVHAQSEQEPVCSTFEHLFTCCISTKLAALYRKFKQNFFDVVVLYFSFWSQLMPEQGLYLLDNSEPWLQVLHPSRVLKHGQCSCSQNSSSSKTALAASSSNS